MTDHSPGIETVTIHLHGGVLGLNGEVACPTCGETKLLTVIVHVDDNNELPSYVRDMHGHTWPEPGLPRSWFTAPLQQFATEEPEQWGHLADKVAENGGRWAIEIENHP